MRNIVRLCSCSRNPHLPLHLGRYIEASHGIIDPTMHVAVRSFVILDPAHIFAMRSADHESGYAFCHGIHRILRYCVKFCRGFRRDPWSFPGIHQHGCWTPHAFPTSAYLFVTNHQPQVFVNFGSRSSVSYWILRKKERICLQTEYEFKTSLSFICSIIIMLII